MKCPRCLSGKLVPVCIRSAEQKRPLTTEELRAVADAVNVCQTCNGTGEITDEQNGWIEQGKAMSERRRSLGFGMREAAERLGILPSVLCDMEYGIRKPEPVLLNKLEPNFTTLPK